MISGMAPFSIRISTGNAPAAPPAAPPAARRSPSGFVRLVVWLLLLAVGLVAWRELEPALTFRPVQATMLSAAIEERTITSPRIAGAHAGGIPRTREGYVPDVAYRYRVDDESYLGSRYSRSDVIESSAQAARRIAKLTPGTSVQVWFNPLDHSDAVIARRPNVVLLGILAGVAMLCGLLWLVAGAERRAAAS